MSMNSRRTNFKIPPPQTPIDTAPVPHLFFHPVIRMKAPAVVDQLTVLSDAIRVRMLAVLEGRELTVSELCDVVQLPQSTVSRHLKTLLDGEWVTSRRDGTRRLYTLAVDELDPAARRLWQGVREHVTS